MSAARRQSLLWLAQRASAAVLALCVVVHLVTMIVAVRGGLTAAEILGRYRYRVQMERDPLGDFLTEIRAANREIVVRAEDLADEIEKEMQEVRDRSSARSLDIAVENGAAVGSPGPAEPGPGEERE